MESRELCTAKRRWPVSTLHADPSIRSCRVVAAKNGHTEELVRSNYFVLRRRTLEVQADLDGEPEGAGQFRILLPLAGEVDVRGERVSKAFTRGEHSAGTGVGKGAPPSTLG